MTAILFFLRTFWGCTKLTGSPLSPLSPLGPWNADKHHIRTITFIDKRRSDSLDRFSSPYLLVFQPLPVPQLFQGLLVFLACRALQQALGIPQGLALQWLYLEAPLLPRDLGHLVPPLLLSLLENLEHPGAQWGRDELNWINLLMSCSDWALFNINGGPWLLLEIFIRLLWDSKTFFIILTSEPGCPLGPGLPLSPFSPFTGFCTGEVDCLLSLSTTTFRSDTCVQDRRATCLANA